MAINNVSKICYLLGVKTRLLERDYEYDLAYYKTVSKAIYLRSLCHIRNTLTFNYRKINPYLKSLKSLDNLTNSLAIVETHNPEFVQQCRDLNIIKVINYISTEINNNIYNVLVNCNVTNPEIYARLFYWRQHTEEELHNLCTFFKKEGCPQGVCLDQAINMTDLRCYKYCLFTDESALEMAKSLPISDEELQITHIDTPVVSDTVKVNKFDITGYNLYVDCDNAGVAEFIGFLSNYDIKTLQSLSVFLFIDDKTNFLWHNLGLLYPHMKIQEVTCRRIIEDKSTVDLTLTAFVSQHIYTNVATNIIIFSSDSDYLGLLQSLKILPAENTPNITFVYDKDYTNTTWSEVMCSFKFASGICTNEFYNKKTDTHIQTACMKLLLANFMLSTEASHWSSDRAVKYLSHILRKKIDERTVTELLEDYQVSCTMNEVVVTTPDCTVKLDKKTNTFSIVCTDEFLSVIGGGKCA